MVVGLATVTLRLSAVASLKDKRRVVRSVVARIRNRYNVAIAEVDDLDAWTTATLGVAAVSNDAGHVHAMLQKVARSIEEERLDAELVDYAIEIL